MKSRLPWILFVASLALNLFFVGGVVYSEASSERLVEDPEARMNAVAERIGLSDQDRDSLIALRVQVRERWQAMRAKAQAKREAALAELAKPELDLERVEAVMRERTELRVPVMLATISDMHAYLATLNSEQKAAFIALAGERGFFRGLFGSRRHGK